MVAQPDDNTTSTRRSPNAAVETRPVGLLPLWFGLLGGHTAWTIQLLVNYFLVSLACPLGRAPFEVFGIAGFDVLMLLVNMMTATVALVAGIVSYWAWQRSGRRGRRGFMALVGVLLSGLFFATILLVATSNLYVDPLVQPACSPR